MRRLIIPIAMLITAMAAAGQTVDHCDHQSDSRARFAAVRILPPVQIQKFEPPIIRVADRFGSEEFYVDKESEVHLPKKYDGKWFWVMYCERDRHLYVITEVLPKQIQKQ